MLTTLRDRSAMTTLTVMVCCRKAVYFSMPECWRTTNKLWEKKQKTVLSDFDCISHHEIKIIPLYTLLKWFYLSNWFRKSLLYP